MSAGLRGSFASTVPAAASPRGGAERFFHDAPYRGGATSSLRAAYPSTIDLGRLAASRQRRRHALDIGEHVAGQTIIATDLASKGTFSDKPLRGPIRKKFYFSNSSI